MVITAVNPAWDSGDFPAVQSVTLDAALTGAHVIGEAVTQTVDNCDTTALGSPAKVVEAAAYSSDGNPTVYAGENNASAEDLWIDEPSAGFLAEDTTITYTIATAGVVFSRAPSVDVHDQGDCTELEVSEPAVLSGDRKSVTVTVSAESDDTSECADAGSVHLYNINYDLAASVPPGTFVSVGVALSGGLLVVPTSRTNAVVFRGITASAPLPTVYIGENNQATGLVTLAEQAAGFFQSGTGDNNVILACEETENWLFTVAPWAKVTAGDLRLRDGSTASTTNIVQGTWDGDYCYYWTVWTASTVPSTIVIGNSTFSSGPLINVDPDQPPGPGLHGDLERQQTPS